MFLFIHQNIPPVSFFFLILPQDFLQYYLSFPNNSEDSILIFQIYKKLLVKIIFSKQRRGILSAAVGTSADRRIKFLSSAD